MQFARVFFFPLSFLTREKTALSNKNISHICHFKFFSCHIFKKCKELVQINFNSILYITFIYINYIQVLYYLLIVYYIPNTTFQHIII